MSDEKQSDLEFTQELLNFLQGNIPERYTIPRKERPKLNADQAWTVIWYLENKYRSVPDHIQRCEVCGDIYDSDTEGGLLDYGNPPYHFCGSCHEGEAYTKKMRRNPNKQEREEFFRNL